MKSVRRGFLLLATVVVAAPGCRTAGVGTLTRVDAPPVRATSSAVDLLVEHNRNAARIQTLEADTTVSGSNRSRLLPGASGKLALERPRNFRLMIRSPMADVGDLGSNDDEFWIWFKDSEDKAIYFCNYDEQGKSPLAGALQPEWIIEAMSLREIPEAEAETMRVKPGDEPGTVVLTYMQKLSAKEQVVKDIILSESTHLVREQRIYSADHKTLMARAKIVGEYDKFKATSPDTGEEATVFLPRKLQLELSRDKVALNVGLSDVKINKLQPARRAVLFEEPRKDGLARINLAERSGVARASAEVREPRQTQPSSTTPRVKLKEPTPIVNGEARRPSRRKDAAVIAADIPPTSFPRARPVEDVVTPPIPTVIDPPPLPPNSRSGWRSTFGPAIER